ncbi:MAG TPA: UvrD-helicase domain-containing protein [Paenalcaligenes sp.]|nr:UvrD-helicase domain-containing protein [Paenalcaligenes sp.]
MAVLDPKLNDKQREAVLYLDGPALVLAGAGSGKTRVITQKIAYLLQECHYDAQRVLALTFTNKAAREMRERLSSVLNRGQMKGLFVGTFHSLGLRFLRQEAEHAGLKPRFSIMDAHDSFAVVQDLLHSTDRGRIFAAQQQISLWKNALLDPDRAAAHVKTTAQEEALRIFYSYEATLRAYQAVDFDDLVRLPAMLMRDDEAIAARWQQQVHYLLVDEYQDTNVCQYEWVRQLVQPRAQFTVVGDDDQAIYAWRGATVENLQRLKEDFPELRLIKLEQNYRSVQRILQAANQVIKNNPVIFGKSLWSDLGYGQEIHIEDCPNERAEAEWVCFELMQERTMRQARWRDFAVLYRSNHQARVLEQFLRQYRIPYVLTGGQSFFAKAEIRDVLAYLRLLANTDDDPAFIRALTHPRKGVGEVTLQRLGVFASGQDSSLWEALPSFLLSTELPTVQREALEGFRNFILRMLGEVECRGEQAASFLHRLVSAIEYEHYLFDRYDERPAQARWQNVLDLIEWLQRKAVEDDLSVLEIVQHVSLVSLLENNEGDEEPDAVQLSTLHAAKGLEFPHVFLVGVEEGLLPHLGREDEELPEDERPALLVKRIEEERRLMYVGITRAQRTLRLSWCQRRRQGREDVVRERSRFVDEMFVQEEGQKEPEPAKTPDDYLAELKSLFD